MNARELFLGTVHFGRPFKPPYFEDLRKATLNRWRKEGMPADVHPITYFGLDRWEFLPIDLGPIPRFEEVILGEDEKYKVWIDELGVKRKDYKIDRTPGFATTQYLEFPVKTEDDFLKMKERYNPKSPVRYPEWWDDLKRCWKDRQYSLGINMHGLFWWVRDLMGLYGTLICFHRNPHLMHKMMDFHVDFHLEALHKAVDEVEVDYILISEDMAYKTGPMISPQMARRFMLPRYKRITRFMRKHGIDTIILDSDGNIELLIPIWLEAGINGVEPCEVAAGMNPVALRKKYNHLIIWGGIDKREIAKDKKAIEKEVMSKLPYLIEEGGYIPMIDHAVPPDVPLKNYLYYRKLVRKVAERGT